MTSGCSELRGSVDSMLIVYGLVEGWLRPRVPEVAQAFHEATGGLSHLP